MCGIAGILDLKGRAVEQPVLERLCACLAHRGPDDEGFHVEGNVALGQRRLSIIDLSSGRQPMSNEDGTVWVTFNGEIYNFLELRTELEAHGHRFATRSDTEVIVHAFEQYGTGCLRRFRGMFAFAIWDQRRRLLFLARDRIGKKPLFYARADGQFVFASELQALLQHPGVRSGRELDPAALDEYLTYGYIPAPGTAFRNVFKLPPAHFLTLELPEPEEQEGGVGAVDPKVEPYWRLEYTPKLDLDEDEAAEALLEILTEAVRLRLIADVPLGALLSGGVDSSVVVALMSRLSDRPVKTFSIGFDEKAFNELPYARLVARRYGTDHHELIVRARALDVLPTLVRHYGEPFADSSAIPSYQVAQLTRRYVTVALNGDGGDECFAGYERVPGQRPGGPLPEDPQARAGRDDRAPGGADPRHAATPQPAQPGEAVPPGRGAAGGPPLPAVGHVLHARAEAGSLHARVPGPAGGTRGGYLAAPPVRGCPARGLQPSRRPPGHGCPVVPALRPAGQDGHRDDGQLAGGPLTLPGPQGHGVRRPAAGPLQAARDDLEIPPQEGLRKLLPAANLDRRKMGFGMPVGNWMRGELRPLLDDVLLSPRALRGVTSGPRRCDNL